MLFKVSWKHNFSTNNHSHIVCFGFNYFFFLVTVLLHCVYSNQNIMLEGWCNKCSPGQELWLTSLFKIFKGFSLGIWPCMYILVTTVKSKKGLKQCRCLPKSKGNKAPLVFTLNKKSQYLEPLSFQRKSLAASKRAAGLTSKKKNGIGPIEERSISLSLK